MMLIFLAIPSSQNIVHLNYMHTNMAVLIIYSLLLSSIFLTPFATSSTNVAITTELFHRDSLSDPPESPFRRLRNAFHRSIARKSAMLNSLQAPLIPAGGEYLMKLSIGTPPAEQLLIADTGSDLLWTQCKPCRDCYNQTLSLFDSSRSSSYNAIPCNSSQCAAADTGPFSCGRKDTCQYRVDYGDGSYSSGELASETLTFDGGASLTEITFGCGHESGGPFDPAGSGIIGLGGGSVSVINQIKSLIEGKFSYCLTLLNSNSSGEISFGSSAVVSGDNSTPLVEKSPATFYFLTLEGFSVGRERVNYSYKPTKSDEEEEENEGNFIIDSGTTATIVPAQIYGGVEAAMKKAVRGRRVRDPEGTFKLCYRVGSGGGIRAPPVTAHFKGADVVLPEESVFVEVEEGVACLTLVPSEGSLGIFGNLHQMNYHVGYDLVEKTVSFKKTDCSKQD